MKIPLVCVIDDDDFFQFATRKMLGSTDLVDRIIEFPDGEVALQYFLENRNDENMLPDLVFLDLNMPYMDGWQFLDGFTSYTFKKDLISIYISTSSTSKIDREKFETYPLLKGFLIKPIPNSTFFEILLQELPEP